MKLVIFLSEYIYTHTVHDEYYSYSCPCKLLHGKPSTMFCSYADIAVFTYRKVYVNICTTNTHMYIYK